MRGQRTERRDEMIQDYEDLKVYQSSYALSLKVYELTKAMPKSEAYGMIGQARRASLSIPLNIAEGYGKRESAAEFRRYLMMAKGSCNEMKVIADFCKDLGYIDPKAHEELKNSYDEIGEMLHGLITKWK